MEKVELEPLKPEQMLEAYRKRFKAIEPFAEDALLTLARMSRGIFRRFLRYIMVTLQQSTAGSARPGRVVRLGLSRIQEDRKVYRDCGYSGTRVIYDPNQDPSLPGYR